jgi:hypothetical protein
MKLVSYRVRNYRSVDDSGVIEVDNLTALVGVNESGKSNLLLPLWKFRPAKEGEIEPTSDFPISKFGTIRENPGQFQFIETVFELGSEVEEFAKITGYSGDELRQVELTRNFAEAYSWHFPNAKPPTEIESAPISKILTDLQKRLEPLKPSAAESGSYQKAQNFVSANLKVIKQNITHVEFMQLWDALIAISSAEFPKKSMVQPILAACLEELETYHNQFAKPLPTSFEGFWPVFEKHIPKFVYYSNYGNLDSEIYLPHVVADMKRKDLGSKQAAKVRTLKVLFEFVGLDPEEILELGHDFKDMTNPGREPTDEELEAITLKKKERAILLQSAGTKLTQKFKDWWKQGDYRFRFQADGDHFKIWVSDDRRPEEVELESRSTGLQWFLSFYLVFLVESQGEHKNSILLLDEPGLSLHPLAQRHLNAFFESLAESCQIIFATHSPFLLDPDNLHKSRKVYVGEDGTTKATSNLLEGESKKSQKGAYYAVSSALNLHVSETLLIGCRPIVVEGVSDQHYLSAIKNLLISNGSITPRNELVFPPARGAKSVKVISSILLSRNDEAPVVLLDDDKVGRSVASELKRELYSETPERVLNVADFAGLEGSEIEDIIPPNIIIDLVDRKHISENRFQDFYAAGKPIVEQIEAWAKAEKLDMGEWKVPVSILVKQRLNSMKFTDVPDAYSVKWKKLFDAVLK